MPQQQLSKTIKKGESIDHQLAKGKVYNFLSDFKREEKWIVDVECKYHYPEEFIQEQKLRDGNRHTFYHKFDVCIYDEHWIKPILFIEINGNIGYWFEYPDQLGKKRIANPTKHSKTLQKINDGINKAFVEKYYPNAVYKVLLKEEINGDAKDPDKEKNSFQYLQREFLEWIK